MKIAILMRYPKMEKSKWKKDIIEKLIKNNWQLSLVFGDYTLWRQLKAGLKRYGTDIFSKRKEIRYSKETSLFNFFKTSINIFKTNDLNSKKAELILKRLKPDILLLLGTGIIKKNILEIPSIGTIHCHQGYLPTYRGINTLEWSIYNGDDVYITTHFVDPGVDTGPILKRKKIFLNNKDTISSVRRKCQEEAVNLIIETVNGIREKNIVPEIQKKEDGKQYFVMSPVFLAYVNRKLMNLKSS